MKMCFERYTVNLQEMPMHGSFIEITFWCSPENLLHISEYLIGTLLKRLLR